MAEKEVVLCGASCYTKKFYLNPDFETLPPLVKDELKITCVMYTEEVSGTIQMIFEPDGHLRIETSAEENDLLYDEIGSVLEIKKMQQEKLELFEALETYYKVMFLGEAL
ncbi:MAG: DUF6145 family protein [Pseudobutyrivibrio sp.]|nr:DUF6145 family protein [Pseudobutyrivibrio sp.]